MPDFRGATLVFHPDIVLKLYFDVEEEEDIEDGVGEFIQRSKERMAEEIQDYLHELADNHGWIAKHIDAMEDWA